MGFNVRDIGIARRRSEEMSISYIWFDLGYTLLYLKRETTYQKTLAEAGFHVTIDELEKHFHLMDKYFMREYPGALGAKPEVVMPWYLGALNYQMGIMADVVELECRWVKMQKRTTKYWSAFPQVENLLKGLRKDGYRLGVISNWDNTARKILEENDLADYFDNIIISSEVGVAKPDPQIFELAFKEAGVMPEECLYIGDNYYDDGVGSEKVGMDYLIINRFGRLGIEELRNSRVISDATEVRKYLQKKRYQLTKVAAIPEQE